MDLTEHSGHSEPLGPRGKGGYYSGALWWDPRDPRDPRDLGTGGILLR